MKNNLTCWIVISFCSLGLSACGGSGSGGGATTETSFECPELIDGHLCAARVDASAGDHGSVEPSTLLVPLHTPAAFTVMPDPGYVAEFAGSCRIGRLDGNTYTTGFVFQGCYLSVSFVEAFEITTTALAHGSISPATATVGAGQQAVFTITPDDGYAIDEATGCGGTLRGIEYRTGPVDADCEISVKLRDPVDFSGTWAGTWQGRNRGHPVSGTWEAEITQGGAQAQVRFAFTGDIDCADAQLTALASASGSLNGELDHGTCAVSKWWLGDFDAVNASAEGSWNEHDSGHLGGAYWPGIVAERTLAGRRIATLDGPRIRHVFPPVAKAGDLLTIVGERLAIAADTDSLRFGSDGIELVPEFADDSTIRVRLPDDITGAEHLVLTTVLGIATSPQPISVDVTRPNIHYPLDIPLVGGGSQAAALAYSLDGRRVYAADPGSASLRVVDVETGRERSSINLPGIGPHAVTVGPAGRSIYVAGEGYLEIFNAHSLEPAGRIDVPASAGFGTNNRGLAISPDGRWLIVTEAVDGGRISIVDLRRDYAVAATLAATPGNTPRGVAVAVDGRHAYIAVGGSDSAVWVYNLESASREADIVTGYAPVSVMPVRNGKGLWILNDGTSRFDYVDLASGDIRPEFVFEGASRQSAHPTGLALAPDGKTLLVATGSNLVYVFDRRYSRIDVIDVGGPASDIVIGPDGERAYVSLPGQERLVEFSDLRTLRIRIDGDGFGTVSSMGDYIDCGTRCSATFRLSRPWPVELTAQAQNLYHFSPDGWFVGELSSEFFGWSGDYGCGNTVTMEHNLECVATFDTDYPEPDYDWHLPEICLYGHNSDGSCT